MLLVMLTAFCADKANATSVTEYPYQPDFTAVDGWTHQDNVNGNSIRNEWSLQSGYWQSVCYAPDNNSSFLFSPPLDLSAGCRYHFKFDMSAMKSSYPVETYEVSLRVSPDKDAGIIFDAGTHSNPSGGVKTVEFDYEPAGDLTVYFSVNACSPSTYNKGGDTGKFANFSITEEILATLPRPVANLAYTPDAAGGRSVTLTWTNPSSYTTGQDLTIASIKVFRGEELVATITDPEKLTAGAEVSHKDEFAVSGKYTYTVVVTDADGLEGAKSITTGYVGPLDPMTPPYVANFGDTTENGFWTLSATETSNKWSINNALECKIDGYVENDAWAITRPLALDATKAYAITYKQKSSNVANSFDYTVALGSTPSAEGMVTPLKEYSGYRISTGNNTFEDVEILFSPGQTGTAYVGFHATGKLPSSYYSATLTIKDFAVKEFPVRPLPATEVTATTSDDASSVVIAWKTSAKSETGLDLGRISAEIRRDGELAATVVMDAGADGTWTDNEETGLTDGFHEYFIVLKNGENASESSETAASGFIGGAKSVPYESDFVNASSDWTVAEATASGHLFEFADGHAIVKEDRYSNLNDWLISPPIAMNGDFYYEISVTGKAICSSSYYSGTLKLYIGPSNKIGSLTESCGEIKSLTNAENEIKLQFKPSVSGDMCIGLHAVGTSGVTGVDLSKIKISIYPIIANAATACSAEVTPECDKVVLRWTMPGTTDKGLPLPAGMKANLYRNGATTPFHTVEGLEPGQECTYTDNEPAIGINTYRIAVETPEVDGCPGAENAGVTVSSGYVGDALEIPFMSEFSAGEGAQNWTQISVDGGFLFTFDAEGHEGHAYLLAGADETANATYRNYLSTPPLKLMAGKTYKLKYVCRSNPSSNSFAPDLKCYIGTVPTVAGFTSGKQLTLADNKLNAKELTAYEVSLGVENTGTYFIGFYVDAGRDSAVAEFSEISVSVEATTPVAVTDARIAVNEDGLPVVSFTVPSTSVVGGALSGDVTVKMLRDGGEEPVATGVFEAGTTDAQLADPGLTYGGYHTYSLVAAVDSDSKPCEISDYVGAVKTLPYSADFAAMPDEWYDDQSVPSHFYPVSAEVTGNGIVITAENAKHSQIGIWSPMVSLTKDRGYRVTMRVNVPEGQTNFWLNQAAKAEISYSGTNIASVTTPAGGGSFEYVWDFKSKLDGDQVIKFLNRENSSMTATTIIIESFSIETAPVVPKAVTELSADADAEVENGVTISFRMPAKTTLDNDIAPDVAMSARIYRGDVEEPVVMVNNLAAGAVAVAKDVVPSNGVFTYRVVAVVPDGDGYTGGDSEPVETYSSWVGAGMDIWQNKPYTNDFTDDYSVAGLTTDRDADGGEGWNRYSSAYNDEKHLQVSQKNYSTDDVANYWLFLMPVRFQTEAVYAVSFDHQLTQGKSADLAVHIAADNAKDAEMIQLGGTINPTSALTGVTIKFTTDGLFEGTVEGDGGNRSHARTEGAYSERSGVIGLNESDPMYVERYIALHATNLRGTGYYSGKANLKVDNIRLERLSPDATPTGIKSIGDDSPMAIVISGDMLMIAGCEVEAAMVYNVSGAVAAHAVKSSAIDISRLPAGVYILKADTTEGPVTLKFRR